MFKKILLHIGIVLLFALLGAYFFFATRMVNRARADSRCEQIEIILADSLQNPLVTPAELRDFLLSREEKLLGRAFADISLDALEKTIESFASIKECNVCFYYTDGTLSVRAAQHRPALRIENDTLHHYLSAQGFLFPLLHSERLCLPLLTGAFPFPYPPDYRGYADPEDTRTRQLSRFISFVRDDPFWNRELCQIHVISEQEIELSVRLGDQCLKIGNLGHFENKLHKIKRFYESIAPLEGRNTYSVIDARYKGQIVCTKTDFKKKQNNLPI